MMKPVGCLFYFQDYVYIHDTSKFLHTWLTWKCCTVAFSSFFSPRTAREFSFCNNLVNILQRRTTIQRPTGYERILKYYYIFTGLLFNWNTSAHVENQSPRSPRTIYTDRASIIDEITILNRWCRSNSHIDVFRFHSIS